MILSHAMAGRSPEYAECPGIVKALRWQDFKANGSNIQTSKSDRSGLDPNAKSEIGQFSLNSGAGVV
jgi:hypothetical protein